MEYRYEGSKEGQEKLREKEIREKQNLVCIGMTVCTGSKWLLQRHMEKADALHDILEKMNEKD